MITVEFSFYDLQRFVEFANQNNISYTWTSNNDYNGRNARYFDYFLSVKQEDFLKLKGTKLEYLFINTKFENLIGE